jgi:hypothetical protein
MRVQIAKPDLGTIQAPRIWEYPDFPMDNGNWILRETRCGSKEQTNADQLPPTPLRTSRFVKLLPKLVLCSTTLNVSCQLN